MGPGQPGRRRIGDDGVQVPGPFTNHVLVSIGRLRITQLTTRTLTVLFGKTLSVPIQSLFRIPSSQRPFLEHSRRLQSPLTRYQCSSRPERFELESGRGADTRPMKLCHHHCPTRGDQTLVIDARYTDDPPPVWSSQTWGLQSATADQSQGF